MQALSAIGQPRLMRVYEDGLAAEGLLAGQVLLAPLDLPTASATADLETFLRLLELGVVRIVNENDAIADDEIRFGDNDRLAALVAHLLRADLLVLLTDTAGLLSADPRHNPDATLIEEVTEIDHELEQVAGGAASVMSRGGMSSKLAAAKMAVWSGSRVVIASARRPSVLADAVSALQGVATIFLPHRRSFGARKLWIAFALRPPAASSSTTVPGAPSSNGTSPCCRRGSLPWKARSKPTTPSRSSAPITSCSPRASSGSRRREPLSGWACAAVSWLTTCPTRSFTGTTSWCSSV